MFKNDHSMFMNLWTHSCTSYLNRFDVSLINDEYDAALWTIVQYRIKNTLRSWIEVMKRQQREGIDYNFFLSVSELKHVLASIVESLLLSASIDVSKNFIIND